MLEVTLGVGIVAVLVLILQPLTARFFKRKWRYWVWLVLALRLLLPINLSLPSMVEVELPRNEIVVTQPAPQPSVTPPEMQEVPVVPDIQDTPVYEPIDRPVYVRPVTTVKSENEKTIPITLVLGTVWITVAVAMFSYQIITHLLFFRRTNRFNHTADAETLELLNRVCSEMGITQKVDVFYNGKIQSPLLVGFFKPRILLPKFPNKTQDIEMILRHELMHFKRHDIWYKLLVRAALSLHWFNPMVWIMAKVSDEDLEKACDEDVVKNQNENFRHTYCQSILHVVRMQKTKEPALAAGFSSRPSDLRNRFIRILDMTRRRGGKAALIIVACITVACTVFIGCELGGAIDVSSNIGPSDTSSQPDETSPYDVEALVKKALETTLSEDEELLLELKNYMNLDYVPNGALLEDVRAIKTEFVYNADYDSYTDIVKTSLFLEENELVLVESAFTYYSRDGLLTSKTIDVLSFCSMSMDETLSAEDLNGAELVFIENTRTCGVYLPSRNSMLNPLGFDLVEVTNVDKNAPTLIDYSIRGELNVHKKAEKDAFVAVRSADDKIHLEYYDAQSRSLIRLSDYEMSSVYSSFCDIGSGRVAIAFIDALAVYDFTASDPFTPISVITKEGMGVEHFDPMWHPVADRNNDKRFLMLFTDRDENLGFVTFDYDGNLSNSFVTDLSMKNNTDVFIPSYVSNIAYFSHNTDEYLRRAFRKYAVDVRKGRSNVPQLQEESFLVMSNITPDEFRYDVSAEAYPFILGSNEKVMANDGEAVSVGSGAGLEASYFFYGTSYDAESGRIEAYAMPPDYSQAKPYIKGKLSVEGDGVYLLPYNIDLIPIPAKTNTGFVKLKIDTNDLAGLKNYVSTFDKENVVICVEGMKITRENGELSYLVEISEMFNGDYDYIARKNKALEIVKTYGVFGEGKYEVVPSQYSAFDTNIAEPSLYVAPLSPITLQSFERTDTLLDWYVLYKNRDEINAKTHSDVLNEMQVKFTKEWAFDGAEFEKTVTQYFDVTEEFLRESDLYDPTTKTYTYSCQPIIRSISLRIYEFLQNGDTAQIVFYSPELRQYYRLTVQLDGDSFRFIAIENTQSHEVPSVFVTNLLPER